MKGLKLTKADKWLIVLLLSAALAGIAAQQLLAVHQRPATIEIKAHGKLLHSIAPRTGDHQTIHLGEEGRHNVVEIRDGRVRMLEANCPDQLCVRSGWVSQPPRQIVCLPHAILVDVVSQGESDVDHIVR